MLSACKCHMMWGWLLTHMVNSLIDMPILFVVSIQVVSMLVWIVYMCVCARAHVWLSILVQVSNTRFDIHTNLGQSFVTSIVEETREGENAKKHYIS